jgi:hypothetical protein
LGEIESIPSIRSGNGSGHSGEIHSKPRPASAGLWGPITRRKCIIPFDCGTKFRYNGGVRQTKTSNGGKAAVSEANMGIQARNVVRKARKVGHVFKRGSYTTCAVGFLARMACGDSYGAFEDVAKANDIKDDGSGDLRYKVIRAVEQGFEDSSIEKVYRPQRIGYNTWYGEITNRKELALLKRYYHVGRNIAKLAGLPVDTY